jgi:hypothetical protein
VSRIPIEVVVGLHHPRIARRLDRVVLVTGGVVWRHGSPRFLENGIVVSGHSIPEYVMETINTLKTDVFIATTLTTKKLPGQCPRPSACGAGYANSAAVEVCILLSSTTVFFPLLLVRVLARNILRPIIITNMVRNDWISQVRFKCIGILDREKQTVHVFS